MGDKESNIISGIWDFISDKIEDKESKDNFEESRVFYEKIKAKFDKNSRKEKKKWRRKEYLLR